METRFPWGTGITCRAFVDQISISIIIHGGGCVVVVAPCLPRPCRRRLPGVTKVLVGLGGDWRGLSAGAPTFSRQQRGKPLSLGYGSRACTARFFISSRAHAILRISPLEALQGRLAGLASGCPPRSSPLTHSFFSSWEVRTSWFLRPICGPAASHYFT